MTRSSTDNRCTKMEKELEAWLNWTCNKNLYKVVKYLTFLFDTAGNNGIRSLERVLKCEQCDVDAYYKLSSEYFNDSEISTMYLCIKCVKTESKKVVDDFPATRSLKVEPILQHTILTI